MADTLAAIADPPAQMITFNLRSHLHFAALWCCLNGVANQRLGQVTKSIRIGPRLGFGVFQLALETYAPSLAFFSKTGQASAKNLRGPAGSGPQRGRAGDKDQVAQNSMRPLRLAEHDSERFAGLGVLRPPQQELGTTDNHRQWIVQLVPGARGKFGQGLQLPITDPCLVVVFLFSNRQHDCPQPSFQ